MESTYELYLKSKLRLAEAGFKLRKIVTNSDELRCQVNTNEQTAEKRDTAVSVEEEDTNHTQGAHWELNLTRWKGDTRFWESSGTSHKTLSHST